MVADGWVGLYCRGCPVQYIAQADYLNSVLVFEIDTLHQTPKPTLRGGLIPC